MGFSRAMLLPAVLASLFSSTTSHAASVYLSPSSATAALADGSVSFELFMDFDVPTIGGGIDLDFSGPISLASFTPSSYFTSTADAALSGYGTANADADFEIHFGDFNGLSGLNKLGDITVNLLAPGAADIALAINQHYGEFQSTENAPMNVTLNGADINVVPAVPLPGTALMLITGMAAVAGRALRLRRPTQA